MGIGHIGCSSVGNCLFGSRQVIGRCRLVVLGRSGSVYCRIVIDQVASTECGKRFRGFCRVGIVDELPAIAEADEKTVYYLKSKDNAIEITGYKNPNNPSDISEVKDLNHTEAVTITKPRLVPYIIGVDQSNHKAWFTAGSSMRPLTAQEVIDIWNSVEIGG